MKKLKLPNLKRKNKYTLLAVLASSALVLSVGGAYAAILAVSARGNFKATSITVEASSAFSSSTGSYTLTYTKSGDTKDITVATTNSTSEVLNCYYTLSYDGDETLTEAILVYLNDNYLGTLNSFKSTDHISEEYDFVFPSVTSSDKFTFELHNSSSTSSLQSKSVNITLNAYTETTDYESYIFVKDEDSFKKAVDDVNSGMLDEVPTIVLENNITLSDTYTLSDYTKLCLNGNTLGGSTDTFTLDGENALIEFCGNNGTFNASLVLTEYNSEKALELVTAYAKEVLSDGIVSGTSADVLGLYSAYGFTATASCTYADNVISPSDVKYTTVETATISIEVDGATKSDTVSFKVIGSEESLLDNTLKHLPASKSTISSSLFLPTSIPGENATIYWTSSNESVMSANGEIVTENANKEEVTLYATAKVNGTVYTASYTYYITINNNEINFYKLVSEISPLVIENVYNGTNDDDAIYYLPTVGGDYDYMGSYESPVNNPSYSWTGYQYIGLKSLTYSMTDTQKANYDYITQTDNAICLNKNTLNNYGNVTITGDFGNGEVYESTVSVTIVVGSNTQLLEKAFNSVSEEIGDVSILANIISTRTSDGVENEKGDFSLKSEYTLNGNVYSVSYSIPSSSADVIQTTANAKTKEYDFTVNPEYFKSYETSVPIIATVSYKDGDSTFTNSRTFYVTTPAALHISDFGDISVFNSVQYQTIQQLPDAEKAVSTGFTSSGSTTANNLYNYILLRDIVGDESYVSDYRSDNDDYLGEDHLDYETTDYAAGVKDLYFATLENNDTSATDTIAYDFVKLVQWATNDQAVTANSVVSNTEGLGSYGSVKSNGKEYLNENELNVLKTYYCYYTGANDSAWTSLYNSVFNEGAGYVYQNATLLNTVFSVIGDEKKSASWNAGYLGAEYGGLYAKYMEAVTRYATTTSTKENKYAPSREIYNYGYLWTESSTQGTNSFALANGKYYNRSSMSATNPESSHDLADGSTYAPDYTSYITSREREVLIAFWLNGLDGTKQYYSSKKGDNATNDQFTSISSAGKAKIQNVLDTYSSDYDGYSITYFQTYGQAIVNAFYACLVVPTYFNTDGIETLIKSFYSNYSYNDTTYTLTSYGAETATPFKSALVSAEIKNELGNTNSISYSVPAVTNLDVISSGLTYFTNLKNLYVYGNENLMAFLSDNGLSTAFSRLSLNNKKLDTLVLQYVSCSNNEFDPSNLSNFESLTKVDLSNNMGISNPNQFVTSKRSGYTYFDMYNINADYEFCEFAIDNIASFSCTVYYDGVGVGRTSTNKSNSSVLADLSDFTEFVSNYLYATDAVYDESASATQVYWRIDEGNGINTATISSGGSYKTISTVSEMNEFISPYYYCTETFTYQYGDLSYTFNKGYVYRVEYTNDVVTFTRLSIGSIGSVNTISDSLASTKTPDFSDYEPEYEYEYDSTTTKTGTSTTTTETVVTASSDSTKTVKFTFYAFKLSSSVTSQGGGRDGSSSTTTYYLTASTSSLSTTTSSGSGTAFFFLSADEVKKINDKYYTSDQNKTLGLSSLSSANGSYYMCFISGSTIYYVGSDFSSSQSSSDRGPGSTTYTISTTSDYSSAQTVTISSGFNLKFSGGNYVYCKSSQGGPPEQQSSSPIAYGTSSSTTWSQGSTSATYSYTYTINPSLTVYYADGSDSTVISSYYSFGYSITKVAGEIQTITQTQKVMADSTMGQATYYYYTGPDTTYNGTSIKTNTVIVIGNNYVYPVVSRSRTYTVSGTFYTLVFWYTTSASGSKITIASDNVDTIDYVTDGDTNTLYKSDISVPEDTYTTTYPDDWDDWSTALTSTWTYDGIRAFNYISYTSAIDSDSTTSIDSKRSVYEAVGGGNTFAVIYGGSTGSETVYKESTNGTNTTYTVSKNYQANISNNVLAWSVYSGTLSNSSGTTMDSILDESNSYYYTTSYGLYYGKYYAYSGTSMYLSSGTFVKTGYVYRLMTNDAGTGFKWVEVGKYNKNGSSEPADILKYVGSGEADEGDIFYSSDDLESSGFYSAGWYKAVTDQQTNTLTLVKFEDLTVSDKSSYTVFTNSKIKDGGNDYLGYAGTFTVVISAVCRDSSGNEFVKMYKMNLVGVYNP